MGNRSYSRTHARRDRCRVPLFEGTWNGTLILLTTRPTAGRSATVWLRLVVPALLKYRWLLGEVFVASFFLQILPH